MTRSLALLPALAACTLDAPMTDLEALDALGQTLRSGQGDAVTADAIEISTDFTLGGAVEEAAQDLAAFWESQADCTTVTVAGSTLTVDYGTLGDTCVWNGKTYAGITAATITSASATDVAVDHVWTGFTDGRVTVEGDAQVTWNGAALTRDVVTAHTWIDNANGDVVEVTGQHAMGTLDGDSFFESGITLDGDRQWTADGDVWGLVFTGVEARWIDPAPQAGVFTVTSPAGKTLDIVFSRLDDTTIQAELVGTRRPLTFTISALGQVDQVE